jgi:hypothetical protein
MPPSLRKARSVLLGAVTLATLLAAAPFARADNFVLIVANNRSLRSHLPDLQYADDDGIRYYQLWESLLPDARLALLAEPDASTAKANPSFVRLGRAPTLTNLKVEAAALAEAVAQARRAGRSTTFYFVFAGHGDVEAGRGYLELADGRLGAAELEALVTRVGAARTHLILDSCNSYFMVRPRKPGGLPLAAGIAHEAEAFAGSAGVGAFLSTSSEQTVYEWSEIQSGIFSYLVRSGLMGGADADRDGRITYDELRGFVGVASRNVPNPAVRPNVFARAPSGDGGQVLLDLNPGQARALQLPGGQRFILRNADGFRLAELHAEASFAPAVRLWGGQDLHLETVVASGAAGERPARLIFDVPDRGPLAFAEMSGRAPDGQVRGADRMFRALFETPFGPKALARQLDEDRRTPPRIYGLSRADTDRLRLNLDLIARSTRDDRIGSALWQTLVAAGLTAATFSVARGDPDTDCGKDCGAAAWFVGSAAAVFGGLAVWNLIPSALEGVAANGRESAASGTDPGLWLPRLSHDLERLAARARLRRKVAAGTVGALVGLALVAGVADLVETGPRAQKFYELGAVGTIGAASTWLLLQESTAERQIRALMADPLWQGISIAAAPSPNGFRLALVGRF